MKYKISRVKATIKGNTIIDCDDAFWVVENEEERVVAKARLDVTDECYANLVINYRDEISSIEALQLLLDEVLTFSKSRIKRIDIQILDNMKKIIEVLENNDFKKIFSSKYSNDINAVRYYKVFN